MIVFDIAGHVLVFVCVLSTIMWLARTLASSRAIAHTCSAYIYSKWIEICHKDKSVKKVSAWGETDATKGMLSQEQIFVSVCLCFCTAACLRP